MWLVMLRSCCFNLFQFGFLKLRAYTATVQHNISYKIQARCLPSLLSTLSKGASFTVEAEDATTQINVAEGAPQPLKPKILNLFLTWSTALLLGSMWQLLPMHSVNQCRANVMERCCMGSPDVRCCSVIRTQI